MMAVSFFIPAYNCEKTIRESVESITNGNLGNNDEIVIVNDGSNDNTGKIIRSLGEEIDNLHIFNHKINKGGGAARNTAAENANNEILFCLDSDNILIPGSVQKLKEYLIESNADIAAFKELHYFINNTNEITHKWTFNVGNISLADCLSDPIVPGASGNYMFTKESWIRAGGYPEFAGALDSWGFSFKQLATGSRMMVMDNSWYYHRHGYDSYWIRESRKGMISLTAIQIIIPFLELISKEDIEYIFSKEGRYSWFENLKNHPIRLKAESDKEIMEDSYSKKGLVDRLKNRFKGIIYNKN
jgi:glycosyltransferase involved in cell wall biosynthesis